MGSPITIRRALLRDLSILVVVMGLAIFGATFLGARAAVDSLASAVVGRTFDAVEARLEGFFSAPSRQLLIAHERASRVRIGADASPATITVAPDHPYGLLEPIVSTYPQVSSAMFAGGAGREHMLLSHAGHERYRLTDPVASPGEAHWVEWNGGPPTARAEALAYDARMRPWHRAAVESLIESESDLGPVQWTEPYTFFTTGEPGITASLAFRTAEGETQVLALDVSLREISEFTRSLRVGERGVVTILTEDERAVGLPAVPAFDDEAARARAYLQPLDTLALEGVVTALRESRAAGGETVRFQTRYGAWWGMARDISLGADRTFFVVAAIPESELLGGVAGLRTLIIVIVVVVLVSGLARGWWLAHRIGRPIEALLDETVRISAGDLEPGPPIETNLAEVRRLAEAHDHMRKGIDASMRLQRIERDLDIARDIQRGLLPHSVPEITGYRVAGWSQPADQTGGDYFDWLRLHDGRLVVTLADATGHGIGPALLIAVARAYLRATASFGVMRLAEAMQHVNRMLVEDTPDGRFITAGVGVLDADAHRFMMASAGHGPLLFLHGATGEVEAGHADAPPLGIVDDLAIEAPREVRFDPGDTLLLITDGFFEWRNAAGEQYGIDRLTAFLRRRSDLEPDAFIRALYEDVLAFAGGTVQDDDLTAVVVRREGTGRETESRRD
ncbi:MAG: SpoIIE family protein phosphatase [Phycisphaerales bacterium]